jgi:hypothetical protein
MRTLKFVTIFLLPLSESPDIMRVGLALGRTAFGGTEMTTAADTAKWTIYYRAGGTHKCEWRRIVGIFSTVDARAKSDEIARMGYRTVMNYADLADSHGLPIGWDATSVDYDQDMIEVERVDGVMMVTRWTSHKLFGDVA